MSPASPRRVPRWWTSSSGAMRPFTREEMRAALAAQGESGATRLRRLRERGMGSLAHRDLNGLAALDEVFATMGALAEESITAAVDEAHRASAEVHGGPPEGTR